MKRSLLIASITLGVLAFAYAQFVPPSGGGSTTFDKVGSGTNTTATMTVGSGGSVVASGTGSILGCTQSSTNVLCPGSMSVGTASGATGNVGIKGKTSGAVFNLTVDDNNTAGTAKFPNDATSGLYLVTTTSAAPAAGCAQYNGTSTQAASTAVPCGGSTGAVSSQSGNLGSNTDSPAGSGARLLGTTYHNTNSFPLYVQVACTAASNGSTITLLAQTDANTTPAQYVSLVSVPSASAGMWAQVSFWVLPGNYYVVTPLNCQTSTSSNGTFWTEWH